MGLGALRDMARLRQPSLVLPPTTLLLENDTCIAIFDKYPKAKYHILVLPRLKGQGSSSGNGASKQLSDAAMDSLAALLKHDAASQDARNVLEAMKAAATEVEEMVRDEMVKTEGFSWGVNVGFHAVPSMQHIHLHVISDDLCSDALKTKKHYNSFRPDLGFFISLREVESWLADGVAMQQANTLASKGGLLSTPLSCFKCGETYGNMPALKQHLAYEFKQNQKKRQST